MNTLTILFIFVPLLTLILIGINILLAPRNPDEAKVSAYECGYDPVAGQTRSNFHIHFFVVALLFLVFDLEILLLFPVAVSLYQISIYGFSVALIFFLVLTIGFILEIGSGAIKITSSNVIQSNPFTRLSLIGKTPITSMKDRKYLFESDSLLTTLPIQKQTKAFVLLALVPLTLFVVLFLTLDLFKPVKS